LSKKEVPEFKWESEDPNKISRLPLKDLARFVEKFHVLTEDEYKPEKYD
jgi:hypothetical protein